MDAPDTTELYHRTRRRITDLVRADGGDGTAPVPACPAWSVRDVVAHTTGICADILAGNMDGVTTEAWTEGHVAPRRHRSLTEVLDEWDDLGPRVEKLMGPGGAPAQFVFDTVTHEHDLRHALGRPGERDSAAVAVACEFIVGGFGRSVRDHHSPPVRVVAGRVDQVVGEGAEAAVLRTSAFEAVRALSGRRSAEEVAALDWGDADPSSWLPALTWGPFTLREAPLGE